MDRKIRFWDKKTRDRLKWHSLKPFLVIGAIAVSVRDYAHLVPRFGEKLIGLGASFSRAQFIAVRARREVSGLHGAVLFSLTGR